MTYQEFINKIQNIIPYIINWGTSVINILINNHLFKTSIFFIIAIFTTITITKIITKIIIKNNIEKEDIERRNK